MTVRDAALLAAYMTVIVGVVIGALTAGELDLLVARWKILRTGGWAKLGEYNRHVSSHPSWINTLREE